MFHCVLFVCFLVVYQKDDNYCCGELLKFPCKGKLGWKSPECATMMRVYLLLLTVRMTRIITTIILTEAHEMAVQRAQRLHLPWHETFFPGLKAQAWCSIYEQTAIKQTWLEVEEVNLNPWPVKSSWPFWWWLHVFFYGWLLWGVKRGRDYVHARNQEF